MSSFDRWLTTDRVGEEAQAAAEAEAEAWEDFVDRRNRPPLERSVQSLLLGRSATTMFSAPVPLEACEEGHEDYAIYEAWLALEAAINDRWNRLQAEEELEYARQEALDRQHELYDYDGL